MSDFKNRKQKAFKGQILIKGCRQFYVNEQNPAGKILYG